MLIAYGFDIHVAVTDPTPVIVQLDIHTSRQHDIRKDEFIATAKTRDSRSYQDSYGNICRRFNLSPGTHTFYRRGVVEDSGQPDPVALEATSRPIAELPDDVLIHLLASRYCEIDQLTGFAFQQFGHLPKGWHMVQAIVDFVHGALRFDYGLARPTRSAQDALREGTGVCRDYAHLTIALCRAMSIPARYATGYLGDIGVPADPAPMDFSAWSEVYIGDRWFTFDARHNRPRIGRIVMAYGRDAADTALFTSFGPHVLRRFDVVTHELMPGQDPSSSYAPLVSGGG